MKVWVSLASHTHVHTHTWHIQINSQRKEKWVSRPMKWANWKRRSKDSWNFSWGKEQGRGHQGQRPGKALVPVASLLFVGDSRWDIKHSEAWCITAFEKRLITLKRDSRWLLACPISLQIPRESRLSAMKTNSYPKKGPYCHLIPGDPEQLVSLFLLSF